MLMFSESLTQSVECFFSVDLLAMIAGFYVFFGLMTFNLVRKGRPFVRVSERVLPRVGYHRCRQRRSGQTLQGPKQAKRHRRIASPPCDLHRFPYCLRAHGYQHLFSN